MELDVKLDSEDKQPKRGPCPFFGVEEGLFFCEIGVETCSHNDNVSSRCTKYWILGKKLIRRIRARCVTCHRIEFNDEWFERREDIIIPGTDIPIPLDIWEKFGDLPNVFCLDSECQPKERGNGYKEGKTND